jgi:antitoxin component YwqK of YwqJK toxin-antitoxin module
MRKLLWILLLAGLSKNLKGQFIDTIQLKANPTQKSITIVTYGDTALMELHPNGNIYRFKNGLEDGLYVAFFKDVNLNKKLRTDTAMLAVFKNGKINGLLRRWDINDNKLSEECEYVNGRKSGFRKLYFSPSEGILLKNIQRWENDILQQDILTEW